MATNIGNLIYHNGTDWGSAALSWPIPLAPETVTITALSIPMPDVSYPDPPYPSTDPRSGSLTHGYVGSTSKPWLTDNCWPHMRPTDPNSVMQTIWAPPIPKDTTETRYDMWWFRSYFDSGYTPPENYPLWESWNKAYVVLINDSTQITARKWTAMIIHIPWGYYWNYMAWPMNHETYMYRTYFNDAWARYYINLCYTGMWDPNTFDARYDWPYVPANTSGYYYPATQRDTCFTVSKWVSDTANGFYNQIGTFANWGRGAMVTDVFVTTSDYVGIDATRERKLVFTQQPSTSTQAGVAFAQQPVVEIRDMADALITTATDAVTLRSGGLNGIVTVFAVAGVATFTGLSVDMEGTDKTLLASSTDCDSVSSSLFDITLARQLAFLQQPSASTQAGLAFAQQPIVEIRDMAGIVISTATDNVTLSIPAQNGDIGGTVTVSAVAGVASFTDLHIDMATSGVVLTATSADCYPAQSQTIAITPPYVLVFTQQPSASTARDVAFAQQPVVEIRDLANNLVTSATNDVGLSLTEGAGQTIGPIAVAAVAGVATFTGVGLNTPGTDKVLTASSQNASPAETNTFAITEAV